MKAPIGWFILALALGGASVAQVAEPRPDSVLALLQEARRQAQQGNHPRSVQILGRARIEAPNSEEVLSDLAENSLAAGDPVGAINTLEPLMRMHPTVAEYPYLLGVALLQVKEFESSANSLRRSLELAPRRSRTLIALGITALSQKRFDEAKDYAVRSLEIDPEQAEALAVLAEAEEGLGELEQAELHANRALALAGPHAGAYYVLGRVRMSQDRFEEAIQLFQQAVEVTPESSRIHYQLSLAYARIGDSENSEKQRQLHQKTRDQDTARVEAMRKRIGLGSGGMGSP